MADPFFTSTPFAQPTPFAPMGFQNSSQFGMPTNPALANQSSPSLQIIDPPDDRYLPGYIQTDEDGDKRVVGPRLKDLNVPFSLYGLDIPRTFGVRRLYGNIIWAIPLRENIRKKKSGGGKGGGPDKKTTTYTYFATYAVSFGTPGLQDMETRDVLRIWADGTLIYDRRGTGRTSFGALHFQFYPGTPDQMPDPTIEAKEGIGEVPAYRDLMYMVIKDLPVEQFGNRPPAISVEIGDATEREFVITNIATPDVEGSKVADFFLPDFETQLAYFVRASGSFGNKAVVRTYNLLSKQYQGHAFINEGDGIGWNQNSLTGERLFYKGVSITSTATYIPWRNQICCAPDGDAGGIPLMLVDPTTGDVVDWCGSNGFVNFQYDLSVDVTQENATVISPSKGVVPYPRTLTPFKAVGLYGPTTFILVNSIYNTNGIVFKGFSTILGTETPFQILTPLSNGNVTAACPGEEGIGTGSVYFAVGTTVRKVTCTWDAAVNYAEAITTYGVTEDLTWKTAFPASITQMLYYASDESLIVFCSDNSIHKVDIVSKAIVWSISTAQGPYSNTENWWLSDISSGTVAWVNIGTSSVRELDLVFGTGNFFTESASAAVSTLVGSGWHDSQSRSVLTSPNTGDASPDPTQEGLARACTQIYYDRLSDDRMLLSTLILALAEQAGYDPADIEISANIDDTIDGAIILSSFSFRAFIDAVKAVYRIDVIESGGKIKFIRSAVGGGAAVFTAVEDDLLQNDGAQPENPTFQFRREEERAIPQRMSIQYIDKSLGYKIGLQTATRSQFISTNISQEQITFALPIIMTGSEAKQLVQRAMWLAWTSRVSHSFRLPPKFLEVEPGDIGNVTAGGIQYKVRTVEITYNFDKSMSVRSQNFLTDEAIVVVGDSGSGYEQELPATAMSETFILDIPLLRGTDDLSFTGNNYPLYWYVGPRLLDSAWSGGTAYMARDFFTYTELGSNVEQGFVGQIASVPTVPESIFQFDIVNTMTLYPRSGDPDLLVSATNDEIWAGANLAAYGRNGRWELIQFKTVTDNGDGTWTLSNLLRGRRGTDKQVDLHQPGDYFVLINEDVTDLTTLFFSDLNKSIDFKGVGFGQTLDVVSPNRVVIVGYGGLPWPPGNLDMERTIGGDGDITVNWVRRSRTNGELIDGGENAPMTDYEENDYLLTLWRHPHYTYTWDGALWQPTLVTDDTVEITVTGATTFALTDTLIRTHMLYEFLSPDNPAVEGTTFSATSCDTIPENATEHLIAADLGYDEWHAFRYLDAMVQQKTNMPNGSGYGPGRRTRVYIRDDV